MVFVLLAITFSCLLLETDVSASSAECHGSVEPRCDRNYVYRTYSGGCNNLKHKEWGHSFKCYRRFANANYPDGYGENITNARLKNPRDLSNALFEESMCRKIPQKHTYLLMMFGQLLGNEMTYSAADDDPLFFMEENPCCNESVTQLPPKCAPIIMRDDDIFVTKYNFKCMNFIRSDACTTCDNRPRIQINIRTSFLDLGTSYGNSDNDVSAVRTYKDGLLNSQTVDGIKGEFLVNQGIEYIGVCGYKYRHYYPDEKNLQCFKSGDDYINNNPPKLALGTIWMREHNRLARMIRTYTQRSMSDEEIFQRARRLTIAKFQAVIYKEVLLAFFGETELKKRKLSILDYGYTQYDDNLDPRTSIEVSSAGLRVIGHSMVPDDILVKYKNGTTRTTELRHNFHYYKYFYGDMDAYLRGSMIQTINPIDTCYSEVMRIYYEQIHNDPRNHGTDLPAIDIQRGRDHGLASYKQIIERCYDTRIRSFDDLKCYMSSENIKNLRKHYKSVDDIDLYVGMAAETKVSGSLLGKAAMCLWTTQFYRAKFGDRFYFEHKSTYPFTPEQLKYLRWTSMTCLLCLNVPDFADEKFQKNAFELPSERNPLIDCSKCISDNNKLEKFALL